MASSKIKMTAEQKKLFDRLTTLQQEVSLNSFSGMNDIDSYKNSSGKAKKENTMAATVSEILRNPNVDAFLDAMKATAVNDAVMSRQEMMESLTKVAGAIANKECEMSLASLTELKAGFDVGLKAMKQLSELAGYDEAAKLEVEHSGSIDIADRIQRARERGANTDK